MQSVRIRKRLDAPIPELPELTPLVGKTVEIIAREEPATAGPNIPPYDFWSGPSAEEQAKAQGTKPIKSIEELRSKELGDAFEGFDEALAQWRREPWRARDE